MSSEPVRPEPDLSFADLGGVPVKLRAVLAILAVVLCVLSMVGTLPLWPAVLYVALALLLGEAV